MHPSHHAATDPDKAALIMAESGETLTYAALNRSSNQGAHLFRALGLATADTIAILMVNGPALLEVAWAAQRSGLYFVTASTKLTADELSYILTDSGATALVYSPELKGVAIAAAKPLGVVAMTCGGVPAADSFEQRRAAFPVDPIADEAPGQDMLYSSGTTGRPKGIKPAPRIGGIADEGIVTRIARTRYGFGLNSVFLSPAPLYHAAPLRFVMAAQQLGATVVMMERFDAEAALAAIERYRVTHAQWVPTHFVRLLKLPDAVRARYDTSSLQAVIHAAAPCPVEIKRRVIEWWGPIVHEYYSSTELIGFTAIGPQDWLTHPGSVGQAMVGTIRICDENGEPLPPRSEGLIHFEDGPPLAYHNAPDKTRAAHNARGWPTIGDIGWIDEEGYLYLTDRQSFMIISGGVNIYPQEIENALATHPKVADAAVFGVPDAEMGERVTAVVQPVDWADAGDALSEELTAWLRERISAVKLPRRFDYRRELPREPTGKLFKRLLVDEYRAAGGRSSEPSPPRT